MSDVPYLFSPASPIDNRQSTIGKQSTINESAIDNPCVRSHDIQIK
jgi:hypothetical protein